MQIVSLIQGFWVALIILMSFVKLRVGLCLYVAYIILVPYMNINFGINLQWNLVNIILLFSFFVATYGKKNRTFDFKPFVPFLILYLAQLLEIPFQNRVPLGYAFNAFRLDIMLNLIPPFIIWNYSSVDLKLSESLRRTVIVCIFIVFGYGLYLTTTGGVNPYQIAISLANGIEWNKEYAAITAGRMFGRISSVFAHPMNYGLFLGMALVFVYSVKEYLNKYVTSFMLIGIITAIFLCGIRSPIGALFATILAFLFFTHRVKLMIQVGIVGCVGYLIIMSIPELADYVGSIFSDKKSLEGGSSFEMRMKQFEGCLYEIRNNPIFGNGYQWTDFYKEKYGDHPILLAFESLIFVVLCNSGFLGIVIWVFFLFKLFVNTRKLINDTNIMICSLMLSVYYLSYTIITGEYGYMKFLILFYILILVCTKYTPKSIKNKRL